MGMDVDGIQAYSRNHSRETREAEEEEKVIIESESLMGEFHLFLPRLKC